MAYSMLRVPTLITTDWAIGTTSLGLMPAPRSSPRVVGVRRCRVMGTYGPTNSWPNAYLLRSRIVHQASVTAPPDHDLNHEVPYLADSTTWRKPVVPLHGQVSRG